MQNVRFVFTAKLARKLLRQGYKIVDITPSRENKDRTVFVFENTESLEKYLNNLKQ